MSRIISVRGKPPWSVVLTHKGTPGACRTEAYYDRSDWYLDDDGVCYVRCAGCLTPLRVNPPANEVRSKARQYGIRLKDKL